MQGPALQENMAKKTAGLTKRLNSLFAGRGVATKIESYSSWFFFHFHNEHPLATLFYYHLRERGIHIQDGFPCFLTTAHSDADIDRIYQAFDSSVEEMQSVGILGTRPAGISHQGEIAPESGAPAGTKVCTRTSSDIGPVPLTESQMEI